MLQGSGNHLVDWEWTPNERPEYKKCPYCLECLIEQDFEACAGCLKSLEELDRPEPRFRTLKDEINWLKKDTRRIREIRREIENL